MTGIVEYIKDVFGALKSLWTGMKVTGYYFVHPKEIVTEQYPENRETLKMFDRFKGELTMPHNEKNEHKCTSCGICEMNCPNGSIEVISKFETIDGKKKKMLDTYIYHLEMCTFCDLCVKTCPSSAIEFAQTFEHAVWDRSELTKKLNKQDSVCSKDIKE
jgi:NADH-quinone oxidoreductase subunit I